MSEIKEFKTRFWDLAPQNLGLKNIFDKLLI